jgi:hypothetical protein
MGIIRCRRTHFVKSCAPKELHADIGSLRRFRINRHQVAQKVLLENDMRGLGKKLQNGGPMNQGHEIIIEGPVIS